MGATIIVEQRHEEAVRKLLGARHGYAPDELHTQINASVGRDNSGVATIETFDGQYELSDGRQTIQLFALETPHVDPMVIAYLPRERILFESDLYTPGQANPNPNSSSLFEGIESLGLNVNTIVGGHGGRGDFDHLEEISAVESSDGGF